MVLDAVIKILVLQIDDCGKDTVRFKSFLSSGIYENPTKKKKNPEVHDSESEDDKIFAED